MSRKVLLAFSVIAVVSLVLAFAMSASAEPGATSSCDECHSGAGVNPVATLVSNNGVTATYNVTDGGLEWAVFSGATYITSQSGATGQFTVAVGGTYTLFGVQGNPGPLGVTTVTPTAPVTFTIMPSAGPNGAISPATPQTVASGSNLTFLVVPDAGFRILDVLVDNVSVGAVGSYTFSNVTANHTISATFEPIPVDTFTLTPSAGPNGAISPATPQTVASGSNLTFLVVPDAGFRILDVLVDNVSVGAVGSYTFSNVTANHTISATFEAIQQLPTSLTLHASAFKLGTGETVELHSVLSGGMVAGSEVEYLVKRPGSGRFVVFDSATVGADGASSVSVELDKNGSYFFRARFLGTDELMSSSSGTVHVVVSQGRGVPEPPGKSEHPEQPEHPDKP